jgi:hypothetical protein
MTSDVQRDRWRGFLTHLDTSYDQIRARIYISVLTFLRQCVGVPLCHAEQDSTMAIGLLK